jgi:hypothetical protein
MHDQPVHVAPPAVEGPEQRPDQVVARFGQNQQRRGVRDRAANGLH